MRALVTDEMTVFPVRLDVVIRAVREEDLPALGWFGMFDEETLREALGRHEAGAMIFLVAEANGHAVGQAWVDVRGGDGEGVGVIWAVRVLPALQRKGIGTRLVAAAEAALAERGIGAAELQVERSNVAARRLYERLGYAETARETNRGRGGGPRWCPQRQWLMRKALGGTTDERG